MKRSENAQDIPARVLLFTLIVVARWGRTLGRSKKTATMQHTANRSSILGGGALDIHAGGAPGIFGLARVR